MGSRKLITISLPPELLKKAEKIAEQENRTKSELLREALRFYIDTSQIRRGAGRERLFDLIAQMQARTARVPPKEIRKVIREAVEEARRMRRRTSA